MPRTLQEIIDKQQELAAAFEQYEPRSEDHRDPKPLSAIRDAVERRAEAEVAVVAAVAEARAADYSWATIGTLLGTSGEAARQRYGQMVSH